MNRHIVTLVAVVSLCLSGQSMADWTSKDLPESEMTSLLDSLRWLKTQSDSLRNVAPRKSLRDFGYAALSKCGYNVPSERNKTTKEVSAESAGLGCYAKAYAAIKCFKNSVTEFENGPLPIIPKKATAEEKASINSSSECPSPVLKKQPPSAPVTKPSAPQAKPKDPLDPEIALVRRKAESLPPEKRANVERGLKENCGEAPPYKQICVRYLQQVNQTLDALNREAGKVNVPKMKTKK